MGIHKQNRSKHDCFCRALELVMHDMQQPLHAARLRVEALMLRLDLEEWLISPAGVRLELEPIRTAVQDMGALMDSVKDVMRVEAGESLSDEADPVPLKDLLSHTLQSFRDRAARRNIRLSLTTSPPLPEVHWLHTQMRCHVLNNLLANALEVSPPDEWVDVSAQTVGNRVEIRISDQGPGIAPEQYRRLFERHHGGSEAREGRRGMGLYSAHLFTRLHGGELYAEEGIGGRGATLVLRLPARPFECSGDEDSSVDGLLSQAA